MNLITLRLLTTCLVAAFLLTVSAGVDRSWSSGIAWAQDDDDDDGGDDDDSADDGGSGANAASDGDGNASQVPRTVRRQVVSPRRAAAAPVLPEFLPEIVALGLAVDDLTILLDEGFELVEVRTLAGIDANLIRMTPPAGQPLTVARDRVRLLPSGGDADFNHLYRANEDPLPVAAPAAGERDCNHANCAAHSLVGWPDKDARDTSCAAPLPEIGIIDTGVNDQHDLLATGRIAVARLTSDPLDASGQVHGTAVVSVFAGAIGGRIEGLLPEAGLRVADVFSGRDGDESADAFSLIRGLDVMATNQIRLVNLSLSGPDNATLANVVAELVTDRGMVLVAAVGNGGADRTVAFPAAYPGVIAVTATDRRGRIYGSAQRGDAVDLAAPGVGLLLATSVSGAKEKTGTSFAAPFVTAAAAMILAEKPDASVEMVFNLLALAAKDLGEAGRDPIFGVGLMQASALCQ